MALVGCAGTGEIIPIHMPTDLLKIEKQVKPVASLRIAVKEFEDGRAHKTNLGVRTHLCGGVSYFDVPGGKPAEAAAQALARYLGAKGWHVVPPGGTEASPDVILSGTLVDLAVNAKSGVGFTDLTTKTKVTLQAKNVADGSIVRMTLNGSGSDSVFWFEPEDAEALINEVLADSFSKLMQDTVVEKNLLRLK
jgi:hypothetical protein